MNEANATFRQDDVALAVALGEQSLRQRLAEQVDASVLHLQVVGQGAILIGNLPQQMLGLEIQLMQLGEQGELPWQRRR